MKKKNIKLPLTIHTKIGKTIVFKELIPIDGENVLIMDCFCEPGVGPDMHVHFLQKETIKVIKGKMAYQIKGEKIKCLNVGESATFDKGCHHRFYNAGNDELHIEATIKPALNTVFFCSAVYEALNNGKNGKPEPFDAAYLFLRYRKEHGASEVGWFTLNITMPIIYFIGLLLGKYKKFKDAPKPIRL